MTNTERTLHSNVIIFEADFWMNAIKNHLLCNARPVSIVAFGLFQQILCALVALFAMVVAVPMAEKGEVGSLLSENIQDMEVAESKAKKLAKKAAKAARKG